MNLLFFVSHWIVDKAINTLLSRLLKMRNSHLLILDILVFSITPVLALVMRLDGNIALSPYLLDLFFATILFLSIKLAVFVSFGFYRRYWRYASIEELIYLGMLMIATVVVQTLIFDVIQYLPNFSAFNLPQSLPLIDGLLSCLFIGTLRFSVRAVERVSQKQNKRNYKDNRKERVLVVGAGSAGVSLVQEMHRNPQLGLHPVAFIDDNPDKQNLRIREITVVGDRYKIPDAVRSLGICKVIIAMPTVTGRVIKEIVEICHYTGVHTSTLPGINEILNGRVQLDSIRDVRIEDLLRREPVQTDIEKVTQFLKGKRVLITGAGGSIGSELCRQILRCCPKEIMLVGHGENSVFNIEQELKQLLGVVQLDSSIRGQTPYLHSFVADIRFRDRLKYAFEKFQPDVIFHAAAHKHVPLMEVNSPEAITNNVIGTKNLVDMALAYNVNHFVMISTDKAVNPTNVMGASKRIAEMLVLAAAKKSGKAYVAVRFGNVLGSRGSVVPTFKKQIRSGGPVTVTHPDICRYFMTIPEAVQLVLQASVLGRGGEVLMLNMGEPVKIVDLAKELIRLSGYEVDKDISISFTGLRPGEKLFEELFIEGEEYDQTEHQKLFLVKNASQIIPQNLHLAIEALCKAADKNDPNSILFLLEQLVPGFKPKYLHSSFHSDTAKNATTTEENINGRGKVKAKRA
ncbi:MAG: nucleoside-diphosphate sugar epimerase/dehydratase [Cyanobacteria bacterium P01_A01_bin.84]